MFGHTLDNFILNIVFFQADRGGGPKAPPAVARWTVESLTFPPCCGLLSCGNVRSAVLREMVKSLSSFRNRSYAPSMERYSLAPPSMARRFYYMNISLYCSAHVTQLSKPLQGGQVYITTLSRP